MVLVEWLAERSRVWFLQPSIFRKGWPRKAIQCLDERSNWTKKIKYKTYLVLSKLRPIHPRTSLVWVLLRSLPSSSAFQRKKIVEKANLLGFEFYSEISLFFSRTLKSLMCKEPAWHKEKSWAWWIGSDLHQNAAILFVPVDLCTPEAGSGHGPILQRMSNLYCSLSLRVFALGGEI